MSIQLIRHATVKIKYHGFTFLIDPMLSNKGLMAAVPNSANEFQNPLVDLTFSKEEVLEGVDAIILTHSHRDHFDEEAIQLISKTMPVFCQPEDEQKLKDLNFTNIWAVAAKVNWNGIEIIRTGGEHGTGEIGKQMGPVSGFILRANDEKVVYIVGDSIWCQDVENALIEFSPETVIVNGGAAQFLTGGPITMDIDDIILVANRVVESTVVVVHMESWNHCLLTREGLQKSLDEKGIKNVLIPKDGEVLK